MRKSIDPRLLGPILVTALLILLSGAVIGGLSGALQTDSVPLLLLTGVLILICAAIAVCALAALRQRKRELDSGEEDEAKKY